VCWVARSADSVVARLRPSTTRSTTRRSTADPRQRRALMAARTGQRPMSIAEGERVPAAARARPASSPPIVQATSAAPPVGTARTRTLGHRAALIARGSVGACPSLAEAPIVSEAVARHQAIVPAGVSRSTRISTSALPACIPVGKACSASSGPPTSPVLCRSTTRMLRHGHVRHSLGSSSPPRRAMASDVTGVIARVPLAPSRSPVATLGRCSARLWHDDD